MKLRSGGPGSAEVNGRAVQKMPNTLQRRETPALLAHHLLQESTYHLVDRGPSPGGHGSRLTQKLFLDDQGHV